MILMGDFNAPLNNTATPFNLAARRNLDLEETLDILILNYKQIPTRVLFRKGDKANCLDLMMISAGLEKQTYNYKLDVDQEQNPQEWEKERNWCTHEENPATTWPRKLRLFWT